MGPILHKLSYQRKPVRQPNYEELGSVRKITPRLAIGLAGPFWGTQEAFALSAADFVACSDAELDNFAMEESDWETHQGPASCDAYTV